MWPPDQWYPTRFGASQKCEFWSPTPDLRNQNPQRRNWIVTSTSPFPGSSGFTLSFEKHRAGGTGWSEPESRGERGQGSKASPARAWSEKRRRRSAGPPAGSERQFPPGEGLGLRVKPSQEPGCTARIIDEILGPGAGSPPGVDGRLWPGGASKSLVVGRRPLRMESLGNNPPTHLVSLVRRSARSWQR